MNVANSAIACNRISAGDLLELTPASCGTDSISTEIITQRCEQCRKPFEPRKGSGGSTQRFCKTECRLAWHAEHPKAQRGPACSEKSELPVVEVVKAPASAPATPPKDDVPGIDWDWIGDRTDVILQSQPALAIYWGVAGHLVIRQAQQACDNDDHIVVVQPFNLPILIKALQTEYDSWRREHGRAA